MVLCIQLPNRNMQSFTAIEKLVLVSFLSKKTENSESILDDRSCNDRDLPTGLFVYQHLHNMCCVFSKELE